MELQQAKEIVINAINVAVQKGCYNLTETQSIVHALEKINTLSDIEFIGEPVAVGQGGETKPTEGKK